MGRLFSRNHETLNDRINQFWQWFQDHEEEILNQSDEPDGILDRISDELSKVLPPAFEFGQEHDGKRDFVLSADGVLARLPRVAAVCRLAPDLPRWNIMPFRQRDSLDITVQTDDFTISADDCYFSHGFTPSGEIDITVYLKGLNEEELSAYATIGFLFLDSALGEFFATTHLGGIQFEELLDEHLSMPGVKPIAELPAVFDKLVPMDAQYDFSGSWSGSYEYLVASDDGTEVRKQFNCRAQFNVDRGYIDGTISDENLPPAMVTGLLRGNVLVFDKMYDSTGADAVLYQGRLRDDGQSMEGFWQLDQGGELLMGSWSLRREIKSEE